MRSAEIARETRETSISLELELDGEGDANISTGIGFFDHMLDAMCRFGLIDLELKCNGDLDVDAHHTVEDCGICLGQAIARALGDKAGIMRVGSCMFPMDEALAVCALDISGRGLLVFSADFPQQSCGLFDCQLAEEFFRAVAVNAGITLHIRCEYGHNSHHMLEAMFKSFGRALMQATEVSPRVRGVPSTKGVL